MLYYMALFKIPQHFLSRRLLQWEYPYALCVGLYPCMQRWCKGCCRLLLDCPSTPTAASSVLRRTWLCGVVMHGSSCGLLLNCRSAPTAAASLHRCCSVPGLLMAAIGGCVCSVACVSPCRTAASGPSRVGIPHLPCKYMYVCCHVAGIILWCIVDL